MKIEPKREKGGRDDLSDPAGEREAWQANAPRDMPGQ